MDAGIIFSSDNRRNRRSKMNTVLEKLIVGEYTITRSDSGNYWITHSSGEGMETPKAKFEDLIRVFYSAEF